LQYRCCRHIFPRRLQACIENQLANYCDGSATTTFIYDGNGQRGKKTADGTTTLYVNKHYEKTGDTATMSYYLGGRLAAQREGTDLAYESF